MDITPTWEQMIVDLVGMIGASDCELDAYDWAFAQLDRIGKHLDSLPAENRLPMVSAQEYLRARREILTA